ncbi:MULTISPECIES: TRAP transporter large permease subunit [unclassified Chelatococcus]|uniref:TRAP transporter large permease n=3 Tax=Chelatococcus TaxID=28209 RepID=UPI001BD138B6|nr:MULTISPECIES: TRAP transporter large permease subunit [unclassified Chelatococcus]CAH1652477.1 TRAP transporter large permease subunit [Hyphomicrobiales bacterium]MBS7743028.1 TRAP transporter large permease subunit [Chelatococcus sp. HY11]MBX3541854.1 TRAP transporter large permease subunit [Chelatococcus sp.]MCO5074255.1 TRAP transporter large permease subunit [Chelatococcus sp.]CAH1693870.1 TRAP transporter large permease subunit [Hyphomicrobiales bacterium]
MSIAIVGAGFAVMLLLMFLSIPVAVTIIAVGAYGGYLMYGMPLVDMMGGVIWSSVNSPAILAIPLFMLLGELLLRGGIADRMYDAMAVWLARLPGGLLHTNIATCTLFSATSGSSVATAATVGTIALPALQQYKYPMSPALGSLAAGGTLGILIPPSVNLLVYGSLANTSVGQLFAGGVIPGLLLALSFSIYIFIFHGKAGAQATELIDMPLRQKLALGKYLIPPLVIFGVVMGSIYGGLATPTESAAIGVMMALGFVALNGRLTWDLLINCSIQSAKTSGMVIIVLVCSLLLNVTISMTGAAQAMTQWIAAFDLTQFSLLLVLLVFYVLLGTFMDAMSMLVLTVPIVIPVVVAAGIDPIWFGIFIVIMCEIALITPPVGMNLFVVHGVRTDGGSYSDVTRGSWPYVAVMMLFTILLIAFPQLVMWLPDMLAGR